MNVLIDILILIYGALFLIEILLILLFGLNFQNSSKLQSDEPKVTLLICARNEENNLNRCLDSVLKLDYPKDQIQVLVGDDNSEDSTWSIIKKYSSNYSYIKGVRIEHEKEGLIAKANVLNQLIDLTEDEFQVIIDADMAVSPQWLHTMVGALKENHMVSGYTQIASGGGLSHVQFFDWQTVLHTMKTMADAFRPISILGNNMGFRKSAYDQVGGFRALGPTDVEDLGLLQLFQKAGLKTSQMIDAKGYAQTQPQLTWAELMIQRCRWMNGVFTHHWLLALPAFFARLWLVFATIGFFLNRELGGAILLYAYFTSCVKYLWINRRTGNKPKLFLYEPVFISLLDTFALLRILVKGKVSWKGRKF